MHPPWRDRWRTSGARAACTALFAFLLASPAAGADDPEPLEDFTFSARLEDAQNPPPIDRVQAMGRFRLGPGSDGANPGDEEVLVALGPFSHIFPAGSFRRSGEEVDVWRVNDPAGGIEMRLRREGTVWTFRISARNLGLSGIENPLSFVLRIGDDEGRQSRYFGRFPRGAWEIWEHPAVTDRDADDDGVGRDAGDCNDQAPWIHLGAPELCNGEDDDCDGANDEDFELGLPCTAGIGACASEGVTVCSADGSGTGCGASPGPPSPEACNGLDDDCDGTADEDLGVLTCGTGLCALTVPACLGGVPQVCLGKDPLPEICGNGVDEDCDGADLGCPEMVLAFTSPPSLATVAGSPVQVAGTVTGNPVELTCNGVPALVSGGSFTAHVPLHEGRNAITCLARDADGLMTTAVLRFTLDTTPPVVFIESPRDGQVTAEGSVTVAGTFNDVVGDAFDNAEVAVSCNGQAATVGNRTFTVSNLPLRPGANALRCTATDQAGNSRQTPGRTVVRQALAGQRIQRVSGDGQSGPIGTELPQPLVVRLVDGSGLPVGGRTVTFRVSRGSGTLHGGAEEVRELGVTTGADGQASVRFRLGLRAGSGDHRVTAAALGFAGEIDFAATAETGEPNRILAVGGDVQRGTAGALLPLPLVALVVDVQGNPVPGVPVTFRVVRGTGDLDGQPSVTFETGTNGRAAATFRLGPEDGVNNNVVEAVFPGMAGLPAVFLGSGLLPGRPEDTRFTGVVLDNANLPIPGAAVTIPGTALETVTDEQGLFRLGGVPVGTVHLRVDGRASPRPETFTVLEFEATTIAGRENTVGMPILIPALDTASARRCGGPAACTLSMAGVPGMTVTIFPGSATFPGGAEEGDVLFTQVHLDKVPMLPPDGALLIPAWTLQPGGTHFDPPAAVTIPNTAGLRPGEKAEIFQFDHDIGDFVSIGLGTVSEDGSVIASDPGYGITSAGWGGFRPPPPPTGQVQGNLNGPPPPPPPPDCNGAPYDPVTQGCCIDAYGTVAGVFSKDTQCCTPSGLLPKQIILLPLCPDRRHNPSHPIPVDGCSAPFPLGDAPAGVFFSFKDACDRHDGCYGFCGTSKLGCDIAFLNDLVAVCDRGIGSAAEKSLCQFWARAYYTAVVNLGLPFYDSAQRADCQCCP